MGVGGEVEFVFVNLYLSFYLYFSFFAISVTKDFSRCADFSER